MTFSTSYPARVLAGRLLARLLPALLPALLLSLGAQAQTPYALSTGNYAENFSQISGWADNFASGTGAAPFSAAAPSPTLPNQNQVFNSGTSGGVQKGTQAIVLLATGSDNANAAAFDLNLDFTGTTAGTISLTWAEVNNSTGNRQSTFKLQTNTGTNGAWVDLPGSSVVLTNNAASSGQLSALALPAAFDNSATAKIRFYIVPTAGGTNPTGSRPKISLDNLAVTATAAGPVTPKITTGTIAGSPFCVTGSAGTAVSVPYAVTGGLSGTFAAQLSDASGSFAADLPQNLIGTGSATPIAATLPAGTPAGSGYRIRVVHAASGTIGSANTADLTVTNPPVSNSVTLNSTAGQSITTTGTGSPLTASATAPSTFAWTYGTSSLGPFTTAISGATAASYTPKGADFGGVAGTYYLVAQASSTCGSVSATSAPVTISVSAPQPTVTASPNPVPDFGSVATGSASIAKPVTLTGSNLSGDVTLTPPAGFQLRTGTGAFSCAALTLTPAGGNLSATVEVRFLPALDQAYSGSISVSSPGAGSLPGIAVSGAGTSPVYPPSVRTLLPSAVTSSAATSGGEVQEDGGSPVTARGVAYATTPAPTTQDDFTQDGTGLGTFTSQLIGLVPNTTYYVRAYATNAQGTSYGEQVSFTTPAVTLAAEPTQGSTLTATTVSPTSVTLTISGGDGAKQLLLATPGPALGFQPTDGTTYAGNSAFGQGDQPTPGTYVVLAGSAASVTVTGLTADTEYTFAVFDYNDDNTSGAENYLLTPHGELTLSTPPLPAGLLLAENFDYPAGDRLTDHGWTAHSFPGTNAILLSAPGLAYSGYDAAGFNRPAAVNAAAALTASGEDVSRTFPAQAAGTAVYASALVSVSSASTADYFLHLSTDPVVSTFRARLFVRSASGGKIQFGVSGSGTTTQYDPTLYELNTTYLLVMRYTFGPSGAETKLYVNPGQSEPAVAGATSTESATSAPSSIGAVALRQGSNTSPLLLDGLRVANSYSAARAFSTPLPVTLTRFSAQRHASGLVQVSWATAQEIGAQSFRVQRSLDGRTFTSVASQAAAGTTSQARQYQALDATAPAGQLYYRLEQQDQDGTLHYSSVVAVGPQNGAALAASLTLAPNPAGAVQALTLTVAGRAGQALTLQVLDNTGRQLYTQPLRPGAEVEQLGLRLPAGLPAGTYVLRLSGAGVAPLHARLVLTR
ncbi:beta strand repeat-containing protein [Hymenobacter sp. 102]|uniref:beta strand repeat-containing protein n=1 Tax=Hymenobacter sp. 102 TaxID=3403152 RepID=UPI003CF00C3C